MALSIQVLSDDTDVPKVTFDAPRIVLGRGQGCDLRLPDATVSRRHASIRQRGSEYVLFDEGSANGTFVGETRLAPGAPYALRETCRVRCGLVQFEVSLESAPASPNPQQLTREIALRLIEGALSSDGRETVPRLIAQFKSGTRLEFLLEASDKPYVVGRGPQSDFDLGDEDVSRRHLLVTRRGPDVFVRDLGAKNPMRLGNAKIPTDSDLRWPAQANIELSGVVTLQLVDPVSDALAQIEAASEEIAVVQAPVGPDGMQPLQTLQSASAPSSVEAASASPRTRPTKSSGNRWTTTDIAVALIAVGILLASLAGIYWLIRG